MYNKKDTSRLVYIHYAGEVENVMILQQIYSGNYVLNLIRIAQISLNILRKTFCSPFLCILIVGLCDRIERFTIRITVDNCHS